MKLSMYMIKFALGLALLHEIFASIATEQFCSTISTTMICNESRMKDL